MLRLDNKTKAISIMLFLMVGMAGTLFFYRLGYGEEFTIKEKMINQEDLPDLRYLSLTNNHSNTITSDEYDNSTYQKVITERIDFEIPTRATHYWDNSGLDRFEMIIRNMSIKGFEDYILKLTWEDDRYINGTMEIDYKFINGVLNESGVRPRALEIKPELNFRNVGVEIGTLIGEKYKLKRIDRCLMNETETCMVNVSYPLYEWRAFENIDIEEKVNFTAIDPPTSVTACGYLGGAGEYSLDNDITETSSTCIIINATDVDFDGNDYTITAGTSNTAVEVTDVVNNVDVYDLNIIEGSVGFTVESGVSYSRFNNINISRTISGTYKLAMSVNGVSNNITNVEIMGFNGGNSASLQLLADNFYVTNNNLTDGTIGLDFGNDVDTAMVSNNNISGNTLGVELNSAGSDNNVFYNNFFFNTVNVLTSDSGPGAGPKNYYNTTLSVATNIIGGANYGGNWWGFANGTAYSQTCTAGATAGICENFLAANTSLECAGCTGTDDKDRLPLTLNGGGSDTCTCAGAGSNWEIDHSDSCTISDDCDLTTGNLSFINSGTTTCNANINATEVQGLATGTLEIGGSCLINTG